MPPVKQSSQPTIRKQLESVVQFRPTINSGSLSSFTGAYPGKVERPVGTGAQLKNLANSLSVFDKSLSGYLEKRLDKQVEEEAAQGFNIFNENASPTRNQMDWKQHIEAYPEHAGLSPYVQRGYEKARLNTLALDFQNRAAEYAYTSGLINEKDPGKRSQALDKFEAEYRKQAGLDGYENNLFLAEHYSAHIGQAKQAILGGLSKVQVEQNQALLKQNSLALMTKEAQTLFHPLVGGRSFDNPDTCAAVRAELGSKLMNVARDASNNGLMDSDVRGLLLDALYNITDSFDEKGDYDSGDEVIALADELTINGVPLSASLGFAKKKETREMHIHAKMQQKLQEDYQKEARRMQHEARIAPSLGIEFAKSDYDKTSAGLASFLKAKGVSNYAFQSAWSTAQFYKANEHQNPLMDETSSSEWMDFLAKHHGRKMEKADYEAAVKRFGSTAALPYYEAHVQGKAKEDNTESKLIMAGMEHLQSSLFYTKDFDPASIYNPANLQGVDVEKERTDDYNMTALNFKNLFTEGKAEWLQKHDGAKSVPPEDEVLIYNNALQQTKSQTLKRWSEIEQMNQFRVHAGKLQPVKGHSSNEGLSQGTKFMPFPSPAKEAQDRRNTYFKKLYPAASMSGKVNTLEYMMIYDLQQRISRKEEPTWENVFAIATGGIDPASVNVHSLEDAQRYLNEHKEIWTPQK